PPDPRGMIASSASPPASPLTASITVPSPPTATTSVAPPATASRASSRRWPTSCEKSASPVSPTAPARRASSGQRLPVFPPSDAGLTRKTVLAMVVRDRRERELGHLVDGLAHVLVRDPHELTLDDDVADDQQAAGLELAQRPEREQHRRLHLDGEDPALRP